MIPEKVILILDLDVTAHIPQRKTEVSTNRKFQKETHVLWNGLAMASPRCSVKSESVNQGDISIITNTREGVRGRIIGVPISMQTLVSCGTPDTEIRS